MTSHSLISVLYTAWLYNFPTPTCIQISKYHFHHKNIPSPTYTHCHHHKNTQTCIIKYMYYFLPPLTCMSALSSCLAAWFPWPESDFGDCVPPLSVRNNLPPCRFPSDSWHKSAPRARCRPRQWHTLLTPSIHSDSNCHNYCGTVLWYTRYVQDKPRFWTYLQFSV